ncbi:MAG TPA: 50S ribosomal protein L11 methyltransferase [bacterium]|nr:50S ribosomal protein L11 methyltransferase [bacterium]
MLDYLVLTIQIPILLLEKLSAWLFAHACLGLETQSSGGHSRLRVYFSTESWNRSLADELRRGFPDSSIESETLIRLRAAEERTPTIRCLTLAGENFSLLSGPAFGSGAHSTTRLCAELMRRCWKQGFSVLDVGTGTGILALLADRLGADTIVGVEISPEARENARANFELNQAGAIELKDDLREVEGRFDLILANLLTPTLLHLGGEMLRRLKPDGAWIVSGVTLAEQGELLKRFAEQVRLEEEQSEGEWLGMKLRKRG